MRLFPGFLTLAAVYILLVHVHSSPTQPNIVWFVTDDQDQMLGGSFPVQNDVTPMVKTQLLMQHEGSMATNFFVHTPICSPSRSELLTGRYFHNIKQVGGDAGGMHVDYVLVNNNTFAKYLNQAGYTVGLFGKYLNRVPDDVPPGFDQWLANEGGSYIAPQFNTKNIKGIPDGSWRGSIQNYTVSVVGNVTADFIRKAVSEEKPFFAYVAPKAVHEPFNPAPWHVDYWDPSWPDHEPRPAPWNCSADDRKDHHGVIASAPYLTATAADVITDIFKNRWRTLLSVDDLISDTIQLCKDLGVEENTYFFYSSDHGFQLGEFNILMDKRHVYDWDTRVHLLARGPGIVGGTEFHQPATMVDMAATFLGIAGIEKPAEMDGKSIAPFIITDPTHPNVPDTTRLHLTSLGDSTLYQAGWRDSVFIEYYYVAENEKCIQNCSTDGRYPMHDSPCGDLTEGANAECWTPLCSEKCYLTESTQNNYIAVRHMAGSSFGDTLYAEFQSGSQLEANINFNASDFFEYYNVTQDPWMMDNAYSSTSPATLSALHHKLMEWFDCKGSSCL